MAEEKTIVYYNSEFVINLDKCVGCGTCADVCPIGCISHDENYHYSIFDDMCVNCSSCYQACPNEAIEYRRYDEEEEEQK